MSKMDVMPPLAVEPVTAPVAEALDPNRWAALAVLLVGAFLAPLDFFIVNVAMPAITADLGASAAEVQLVISGYAVVYAVLLITGGRLGDIHGRKSVFLAGLAGFAAASAFCGLAWSAPALIAARLLQGLAAAAMAPQALASIHALFPARERGRALGIYGVAIGLSSAVGQLLGGALVAADPGGFGWRLVFLINLPIAAVAVLAAIPLLRETRSAVRPRLDWAGVALSTAALGALVLPLVLGREQGWPWWAVALIAVSPGLVELFRRWERRLGARGGDPLVALEIFRSHGVLRGLGAILTLYAMAAFFLTYSIYLQTALGFSAFEAGLAILPFSAGFLLGSTGSPLVGRWLGTSAPSLGFAFSSLGAIATALVAARGSALGAAAWPPMAPAVALIGLGMGVSIPTLMRVIVERVPAHRAGLVGGLVNSTLQVSAALGVAILGGVFFATLGDRTDPDAVARAFATTLIGVAAAHFIGGLLAAGLGQRRPDAPPATLTAEYGRSS